MRRRIAVFRRVRSKLHEVHLWKCQATRISVGLMTLLLAIGCAPQPAVGAAPERPQISEDAKKPSSPAQTKIDTRLRAAIDRAKSPQTVDPQRRPGPLDVDSDGKVLVDIRGSATTELAMAITALGGLVINSFPEYESMRARVPLLKLEQLAERSDVRSIRPAEQSVNREPSVNR